MLKECCQSIPSFICQDNKYVHFSHMNSYLILFVHYCQRMHNSLHVIQTTAVKIGGKPGHKRKSIQRTHLPCEVLNTDITSKFDPL